MAGCVGVSVQTFGAANLDDFHAEETYKSIYGEQMAQIRIDTQPFMATSTSPGVCNIGGTKQGCYDADEKLIQDFQAMLKAFEGASVPPRYVDADRLFRSAIAQQVRGLELRNRAIAKDDSAAWTEHQTVLEQAAALLQQAYQAFPGDNRPQPPP